MNLILSIETSTNVCSAALHRDDQLLGLEITHEPNSAASQLAVMIDRLLKNNHIASADLTAVAVSAGPGSYTGLRIGVATAKGMCYALGIPLVAVNSLEIMAAQINASNEDGILLCPMIDARRMEVYTMLFDRKMNVVSDVEAKVIDEVSYADQLKDNRILFFGNGAAKVVPVLKNANAVLVGDVFPSAEWLGKLAEKKVRETLFEDVGSFEPFYLKDFVAKKPKSLV